MQNRHWHLHLRDQRHHSNRHVGERFECNRHHEQYEGSSQNQIQQYRRIEKHRSQQVEHDGKRH